MIIEYVFFTALPYLYFFLNGFLIGERRERKRDGNIKTGHDLN